MVSSLILDLKTLVSKFIFSEGFITFCHVDDETRPIPHNITLIAETPEEINLQQEAKNLLAYISKPK